MKYLALVLSLVLSFFASGCTKNNIQNNIADAAIWTNLSLCNVIKAKWRENYWPNRS
jgi:hypothetical protein